MVGQAQKEVLPETQFPESESSSPSLLQVLAASLPMAIESRLEISMMEPRSKWYTPKPRHRPFYGVQASVQH